MNFPFVLSWVLVFLAWFPGALFPGFDTCMVHLVDLYTQFSLVRFGSHYARGASRWTDLFQSQSLCLGDRKVDVDVAEDKHAEISVKSEV